VPTGPAGEPQVTLGPTSYPGYHVKANASTSLPGGALGFLVTANGQGAYRVVWTDTLGAGDTFSGTLTTDGSFDATKTNPIGNPNLQRSAANQYAFSSTPGANLDGFDVVSSTDPVYLEAKIDGSTANVAIYFTGATTSQIQTSALDPVAFTSP
jgi:hypothetical protein